MPNDRRDTALAGRHKQPQAAVRHRGGSRPPQSCTALAGCRCGVACFTGRVCRLVLTPCRKACATAPPPRRFRRSSISTLDTLADIRPPRGFGRGLNQNEVGNFCPTILGNFSPPLTGGALIIYENIIDDGRRENALGLLMSLNMLIETKGGFDYTATDSMGWMGDFGFRGNTWRTLGRARVYGDWRKVIRGWE